MDEGYFLGARICLNGHDVCSTVGWDDHRAEERYCKECGAEVVHACPSCGKDIQGSFFDPMFVGAFSYDVPKYCISCGAPYPWTQSAIEAVKELAELDDMLTEEDAEALGSAVADSMSDNPKTKVAVVRIKKILGKAGKATADAIRDIVVDVASEAAKKMLVG